MGAQQSRLQKPRSRSASVSSAPPSPGNAPVHIDVFASHLPENARRAHDDSDLTVEKHHTHLQLPSPVPPQHPHLPRQYHPLHHTWSQHEPLPDSPALSATSTSNTSDLRPSSTRTSEGGGGRPPTAKKQFAAFLSNLKNRSSASFGSSSKDPTAVGLNLSQDSLGTQTTMLSDSTTTNQSGNSSGRFNLLYSASKSGSDLGSSASPSSQQQQQQPLTPKEAAKLAKKAEEDARLADLREQKQQKKINKQRERQLKEAQKQQLQQQKQQEKQRRLSVHQSLPSAPNPSSASWPPSPPPVSRFAQSHQVTNSIGAGGPCSSDESPTIVATKTNTIISTDSEQASSSLSLAATTASAVASIAAAAAHADTNSSSSSSRSSTTVVAVPNPLDTTAQGIVAPSELTPSASSTDSSSLSPSSSWRQPATSTATTLAGQEQSQQPSSRHANIRQQQQQEQEDGVANSSASIATTTSAMSAEQQHITTAANSTATSLSASHSTTNDQQLEVSNTSVAQTPQVQQQQAQQKTSRRKSLGQALASAFPTSPAPSSSSSTPATASSPSKPNSSSSGKNTGGSSSTTKFGRIRGKAGFAWLEKRLAGRSGTSHNMSVSSFTYDDDAFERRLDEMEHEAAKQYKDRVAEQHFLMKDVMGGNYHVPIDLTFKRVLENGCGAGDWTLDMASDMPETDFVGCPQIVFTTSAGQNTKNAISRPRGLLGADQSQQGTGEGSAPPLRPRNCSFITTVPMNRLPFHNDQFDFVYQRRQCVVLLSTEWQRTILELFRVLRKGGWVEIVEPDLCLQGGGELCQLAGEYCIGIFEALGRNPNVIHEMPMLLESAGFVNVQVKVWSMPLGWGGQVGKAMLLNQRLFVNELEPIYVRQGHGDSKEYKELTEQIFQEAIDRRAYINYHSIIAQKPSGERHHHHHKEPKQPTSNMLA